MASTGVGPVERAGPAEWLERLAAVSATAARKIGVIERLYRIGGRDVCMRFAGKAMWNAVGPSFAHLEAPRADDQALTVELWDAASTATAPPPLPPVGDEGDEAAVGALYHYVDAKTRAVYQPGFGALSVLEYGSDAAKAWRAFYWLRSADELPYWERASPIRQLLHWWLGSYGMQQVHAAAVGLADAGVLLVGNPGSGKSTSALSSLDSPLLFAGDDYVAVQLQPEPHVYSLYNAAKLEPHQLQRLPHVQCAVANAERLATEKAVIHVHEHFPTSTTTGFPLRAILLPTICDQRASRVVPAPRKLALHALAPSTMIQLHTAGADALTRMKELVVCVPAFVLELGSDLPAIARTICDYLEHDLRP
jgi:hypothetical protein